MKLSIVKKVNLLSLSIILLFGILLGYVFIKQETAALKGELEDRAKVIMAGLKVSCEYPVMIRDIDSLKKAADASLEQKDVVACKIFDSAGALLYSAENKEFAGSKKGYQDRIIVQKRQSGLDALALDDSLKPESEDLGSIYLEISFEGLNKKIKDVSKSILIMIVLAIIFLSITSSVLFRYVLSNPINDLVTGTQKIAFGDLTYKVKVRTKDEIGMLGESFNKMTDDLQRVTVSRDYVDNIINTMNDSLLVINPDKTIRTVNTALIKLLGYDKDELTLMDIEKIFDEEAVVFKGNGWNELLAKGSINDYDVNLLTKSGEKMPVSFSGSVMKDNMGRAVSFVGIARDMREMIKLKRQLFQTEKMAAVGQLAGGVAHEINNPMSVILGFAQTVSKRITDESNPLYMPLKSIEREALRCKRLVGDLLTFSRVSKTDTENIDVEMLIEETLSLIESKCRVKDVELKKEIPKGLKLHANKNQIQQVIVNLCNNALDSMDKGGTLTIKAEETGKSIKLYVTDTGSGIPPEIKERIFEPFFTTKEVGKGTGLGLSISYEIIQKHNGTIEVESEPGKGTTFTIIIPSQNPNG